MTVEIFLLPNLVSTRPTEDERRGSDSNPRIDLNPARPRTTRPIMTTQTTPEAEDLLANLFLDLDLIQT